MKRSWIARVSVSLGLLLGIELPGHGFAADEDLSMNRVSFQVEASRDVENDWVTAVLGTTEEDASPAVLADRINKTMGWALEIARKVEGITVKSGSYQTFPVQDKDKIVRWRGSQNLVLESAGVAPISKLIGELQSRLQVESVRFSVSPERRRAVEDELIREALDGFKARALIVRASLGFPDHELVQLSINGGGGGPAPVYRAHALAAEVAQPDFEQGTSSISVNVSGTIELQ